MMAIWQLESGKMIQGFQLLPQLSVSQILSNVTAKNQNQQLNLLWEINEIFVCFSLLKLYLIKAF